MQKIKSETKEKAFLNIVICIYYFIYFSVVLKSGYLGDDAINANIGGVIYHNTNIIEFTNSIIKSWIKGGRFFPFAFYMYEMFSVISSRIIYKFFIILSIYVNSILFGQYLKRFTGSDKLKYCFIMFFPLLIQLTSEFNSPIYSFHMLLQFTLMWLLISLHLLLDYSNNGKSSRYLLSIILFFISLGTYEIAYTFILFIILTAVSSTHNTKIAVKIITPFVIVFAIMVSINIYCRLAAQQISYSGVSINLNIAAIVATFFKQCSSALPLARYFAIFGQAGYPYTLNSLLSGVQLLDILVVTLFFSIIWLIKKIIKDEFTILNSRKLLLMALLFFTMPSLLIAISEKYQRELQWGVGHLSFYIQCFGFTLMTSILYFNINKLRSSKVKKVLRALCAVIAVLLILINQQVGRISVDNVNEYFRWPRENVENAISKGILTGISSRDVLIGTTNYTFDSYEGKYFYSLNEKKLINEKSETDLINELKQKQHEGNLYDINVGYKNYAIYSDANKSFGYAIIGECTEVEMNHDKTELLRIAVINPKVYIQGEIANIDGLRVNSTEDMESYQYSREYIPLNEFQIISEEYDYKLYQINYNGKIDLKSIEFNLAEVTSNEEELVTNPSIYCELGNGFTGIEGEQPKQWMWLSNNAEIKVYNYLKKDLNYSLNFNIYSGYEATSNLELYINDELYKYDVNLKGTRIEKDIILNIGENIIKFKTDSQRVVAPDDPRELYLRISDFNHFNDINTSK